MTAVGLFASVGAEGTWQPLQEYLKLTGRLPPTANVTFVCAANGLAAPEFTVALNGSALRHSPLANATGTRRGLFQVSSGVFWNSSMEFTSEKFSPIGIYNLTCSISNVSNWTDIEILSMSRMKWFFY